MMTGSGWIRHGFVDYIVLVTECTKSSDFLNSHNID